MAYRIYDYSNTHVFHRKALLNAVEMVNAEHPGSEDVLVIVSARNMLKSLFLVMLTSQKTVVNLVGFGRLFSNFGPLGRLIFDLVVKLYGWFSAKAFIVEHDVDYNYLKGLTTTPIYTSHGSGLDIEGFTRAPKQRGDSLKMGYLSRFHPSKGSDQILKAAKTLPEDRELIIAGWDIRGNKYAKAFSAIADTLPNVTFLGKLNSRSEVSAFFNNIDLFLSPSVREGGNIALQEGIWHGVPFITTDAPGCKTLAERFGGLAVPIEQFSTYLLGDLMVFPMDIDQQDWDHLIQPFLSIMVENELKHIFSDIMRQ